MLPDFLKPYERDLETYKLDYIKIAAQPLTKKQATAITESKFLGKPYLPLNFLYPKDERGYPMILLAQINFAEIPRLADYPEKGILQLFVSGDNWYDMEDYKVLYHADLTDAQSDFSFLKPDLYEESPIDCEHRLTFTKATEWGGSEDFRFEYLFDGQPYWDFEDGLSKEQQDIAEPLFSGTGHKIGGYACFTQDDPRYGVAERKDDVLLLQIDIDDEIMFGDSGVAHLLINRQALIDKDFSSAYFHWDCC